LMFTIWYRIPPSPGCNGILGLAGNFGLGL